MPRLHCFVRQFELSFSRLVRRNLRRACSSLVLSCEMFLNLLPTRTRRLQILFAVAFDFRLAALAALGLIAKFLQPMGQLRAVHRRRVPLGLVEFPWLQGIGLAVLCLGEIEKDDVRVQLWCRVAVDRPCTIVLELRRSEERRVGKDSSAAHSARK